MRFKKNIIKLVNKIKEFVQKKILKSNKWKLFLYLNGQCVSKRYISADFAPMNKFYVIKVKHAKHLIGTNRSTQLVVRSYKYKMTDEAKREAHIEVIIYEGSDI